MAAILGNAELKGGKVIATGVDAIMTALDEAAKARGTKLPQQTLDEIKTTMAGMANPKLHEMPDGNHVISGSTVEAFRGDGGLDLDQLKNAMRYSDRHGGRSAFDDFADFFGPGKPGRSEQAQSPLGEFMRSMKQSLNDEPRDTPKNEGSPTATFMLTSAITAVALTKYGRWQKEPEKAAIAADSFAKLIGDLQAKDPVRFDNLAKYLEPYAVNLGILAEDLRTFAKRPRADAVDSLVGQLAKLVPVLVNAVDDAKAKAKEVSEAALAI
ncbi:MAG: hypothetical protein Athens041674_629 [Parcubacteria group bacterium Athens0416_74]|nr:MAG: hypothetical protein Athens041674_629 [Parcubacteria group bacterium Athens0416_74]